MGLFDKIFKQVPEEDMLTKQEAFAGIALAMAGADGSIAQSEWDGIVSYIRRLRLYDNFSGPAFDKMFDKLFRILKNQGASALVAASVTGLPEDLKLTALHVQLTSLSPTASLKRKRKTSSTSSPSCSKSPSRPPSQSSRCSSSRTRLKREPYKKQRERLCHTHNLSLSFFAYLPAPLFERHMIGLDHTVVVKIDAGRAGI